MARLNESTHPAEAFQAALAGLGTTRVRYRIEQTVDLDQPCNLDIGRKVPFVCGTSVTANGQVTGQVEYEKEDRLAAPDEI